MGEAKRRGTFEERKAAAIKRKAEKAAKRKQLRIAKELAMSPEERLARREADLRILRFLSWAEGLHVVRAHDNPQDLKVQDKI